MAHVSEEGLELIKRFEGFKPMAYRDIGGVWTIGYGHTGPDVTEALIITQQMATALLEADVRKFEICVENALHRDVTQQQFDAMVSLAFNVGCNAFRNSTLLKHVNAGRHHEAALEFGRWNKVGEREIEGLTRRRGAEATHYRRGTG